MQSAASNKQLPRRASSNQPQSTTQETTMNTSTTSSPLRGLIAAAIFSTVASGFSAASIAADTTDAPQVVVQYQDLDLSNPQGAATLYRRISAAAERVCPHLESYDLSAKSHADACMHKAIANAVAAVNSPALVAEYNANNSSPLPVMIAAGQGR
jgi:UrcA family protein